MLTYNKIVCILLISHRTTDWTDIGPIGVLMYDVRKRIDDLQSWFSSLDENNLPEFKYGDPQSGNLCDFLTSVSEMYEDHTEYITWNNEFRQYLHHSEINLWLLVLQQPGRLGTVEYLVDFSAYDIYNIHTNQTDIFKSYLYYIDTVIGKTMLGFFYKVFAINPYQLIFN